MAENDPGATAPATPEASDTPAARAAAATPAAPAAPPRLLPWLLAYTAGRLVVAAALVGLLWAVGIPGYPALLFGALLSMPVAYFLLQPVRDRFTAALAARGEARRAAKEDLRARLSGPGSD